jgi:putative transposase
MSRKSRFLLPGMPQHVIQRGHNREPCFFAEEDYQRYLHDAHEAALKNRLQIHSYVLMTNHVHLLVTPEQPFSVMHAMQDLGRKYVRYINHSYKRTGGLWEGRYKASLVDSEAYLLTCMRYIEMNPVRAGMVEHPGEYRWSSYSANADGESNVILTMHPLYKALGRIKGCVNMHIVNYLVIIWILRNCIV